MPELIRLQTPDFEFSVWANDISQRAKVYQSTVSKRSSFLPNYSLRFAPEAELVELHQAPQAGTSEDFVAETAKPVHRSELVLSSPLFFENTQYQFEWVFFW